MHLEHLHLLAHDIAVHLRKLEVEALGNGCPDGDGRAVLGVLLTRFHPLLEGLRLARLVQPHLLQHLAQPVLEALIDGEIPVLVLAVNHGQAKPCRAVGQNKAVRDAFLLKEQGGLAGGAADRTAGIADHRAFLVLLKVSDAKVSQLTVRQAFQERIRLARAVVGNRFRGKSGRADGNDRDILRDRLVPSGIHIVREGRLSADVLHLLYHDSLRGAHHPARGQRGQRAAGGKDVVALLQHVLGRFLVVGGDILQLKGKGERLRLSGGQLLRLPIGYQRPGRLGQLHGRL